MLIAGIILLSIGLFIEFITLITNLFGLFSLEIFLIAFLCLFLPGLILFIVGMVLRRDKKRNLESKPNTAIEQNNKEHENKTCHNCGKEILESFKWCPYCGYEIANENCKKCGAKVDLRYSFCSQCGSPIKPKVVRKKVKDDKTAN